MCVECVCMLPAWYWVGAFVSHLPREYVVRFSPFFDVTKQISGTEKHQNAKYGDKEYTHTLSRNKDNDENGRVLVHVCVNHDYFAAVRFRVRLRFGVL